MYSPRYFARKSRFVAATCSGISGFRIAGTNSDTVASRAFKILSGDTTNCPMRTPEWSTSNRSATPLDKLKVTKWRPLVRNVCNFTLEVVTNIYESVHSRLRASPTWNSNVMVVAVISFTTAELLRKHQLVQVTGWAPGTTDPAIMGTQRKYGYSAMYASSGRASRIGCWNQSNTADWGCGAPIQRCSSRRIPLRIVAHEVTWPLDAKYC
mmetsp:Transcript_51223/g.84348  ORF Transcript_51223/g.84348 Transcript_51223/m.84348 type:complete len:210 (-) Transcript_51223:55-684(-)